MKEAYRDFELKNRPGEIWKPIPGFPKYKASNLGRIKSFKRKPIIIRQTINDRGYLKMAIYSKKCGKYCVSAHQAVALAFCENPMNHKEVNHIDGDKLNNHASNLAWCSRSENMRHMISICGPGHRLGMTNPKAKLVMHTEYGIFCTIKEAAQMTKYKYQNFYNIIHETGYRKNKTKFVLI
jgi:hypothetical protein